MKVELRNIHKHFGPVRANDGISLLIEPGTIHGILGENGAGKSTLMKVLTGFIFADSGEIVLDGRPVALTSPAEAVRLGVGMLHQDPLDFPALRVLDNLLVGSPGGILPDRASARQALQDLCTQFDFKIDPDAQVASLSIGERQQLEIARLLWLGVRVLILDEPTTAISAQQRAKLFAALRKLAAQGKTVIFVSHKLEEVEDLCTQVSVMARGKLTGEATMPCPTERLVQMMFGQVITFKKREALPLGDPIVTLDRVTVSDWRLEVNDLSLELLAGQVIGLAGLEGSGQRLLLQALGGLLRPTAGHIRIGSQDMTNRAYRVYLQAGVAYVPANRLAEGLVAGLTVTEHVALAERKQPFLVNWQQAGQTAVARIKQFNIKGTPTSPVEALSGGNQQRTLLGLLPLNLRLLLMEQPTRGLDMESIEYIWGLLQERTRAGMAIVFASADLDELLDRSDHLLVFFGGRVVGPLDSRLTTVEQLGELIGGKGFA
ncbi:MAG: ATP-binding cassette domain-containing protein [Anaerolineae bacterium]|uniref:ABC transporter ATP-binding protein n=1 Tax=Candidatus Amarolinea dominans TaxID=3140696 RepID=UPI0031361A65|nr:ATP-binding cassette domain-containing protein [Anaerolineae bacterium]